MREEQPAHAMNPCETCLIEEKLYECCGRHPETGAVAWLKLTDGRRVLACPHLSRSGTCLIYEKRPYGCGRHECACFSHQATGGQGGRLLAALWGPEDGQ